MAKTCPVCKQSYADELAACPHCSSAVEIVLGDPPRPPSQAGKPAVPPRFETGSDSEIEIDLGKLPPPAAGEPTSGISNVEWSSLVSSGESGVDLAAGGLTVDSPSDAALLKSKKPDSGVRTPQPGQGQQDGSWVEIHLGQGSSGIVVEPGGGKVAPDALGLGSGSDEDIDLARLESEGRVKPALPAGLHPGSGSDIDLGALTPGSSASPSPLPEALLPSEGSEVDLGRGKKTPAEGPSGLDLVAEALDSGSDVSGQKAPAQASDSGVDLAALFEDSAPPAPRKPGQKSVPRSPDASSVDLGSLPPPPEDAAQIGSRGSMSSHVELARRGAAPEDSGVNLGVSALADSGVDLADDDRGRRRPSVPAEPKSGRAGAWVGGGVAGALVGVAASLGLWFSGLLPGSQEGGRTTAPPVAQADAELKTLRAEAERLETEAKEKSDLAVKLEADLKAATAKAAEAGKETAARVDEARKQALAQAAASVTKIEVALKQAQGQVDDALKRETALKLALDDAKKAADPKALLVLKMERELAAQKLAESEKARLAAEKKLADLDKMVTELATASKAAEKKAADLATAHKAAEQKVMDLTALMKKGGAGDAALQKLLEAARAEATDARKRLDDAARKLEAAEKTAQGARADADQTKKLAADAQKSADLARATAKMLELKLKESDTRIQTADARAKDAADQAKRAAADLADVTKAAAQANEALQALTRQLAEAQYVSPKAGPGDLARGLARALNEARLAGTGTPKAGVARPEFPTRPVDPLEAEDQYTAGRLAFHAGNYAEAEQAFFEAARHGGQDARYLYFLGLARFAQGKGDLAAADFRDAARLERQSRPGRATVNAALERVQGPAREAVERFRQ